MVRLKQVGEDRLDALMQETKRYLPNSCVIYGCLSCGFISKSFDLNKTEIFIPDEEMPFFVIITGTLQMGCQNLCFYWDFESISLEMVKHLFTTLPQWDWLKDFFVYGLDKKIQPLFDEIILGENGLGPNHTKEKLIDDSYSFTFEGQPDPPNLKKEYYLDKLSIEHSETVYKNWMYSFLTTPSDVGRMIENLPTSAVFLRDPTESDSPKLVAWVLTKHQGEAGFTYTLPEYRQKGLAAAVVIDLVKKNLINGYSPHAFAAISNTASVCFHEKIGYKKASIVEWVKYSTVKG